jgi:hypothetical protein
MNAPPWQCCCIFLTVYLWLSRKAWDHTCPTTSVLTRSRSSRLLFVPEAELTLKGWHFESVESIQETFPAELHAIPQKAFQQCFQNLGVKHTHTHTHTHTHWEQCISGILWTSLVCPFLNHFVPPAVSGMDFWKGSRCQEKLTAVTLANILYMYVTKK